MARNFNVDLGRQLAQVVATTSPVSIYAPASHFITHITSIWVLNDDTTSREAHLFHDEDGTTYTNATSIWHNHAIAAKVSVQISDGIWMNGANGGNFAIESDANSVITVTLYGIEYKVK